MMYQWAQVEGGINYNIIASLQKVEKFSRNFFSNFVFFLFNMFAELNLNFWF